MAAIVECGFVEEYAVILLALKLGIYWRLVNAVNEKYKHV